MVVLPVLNVKKELGLCFMLNLVSQVKSFYQLCSVIELAVKLHLNHEDYYSTFSFLSLLTVLLI